MFKQSNYLNISIVGFNLNLLEKIMRLPVKKNLTLLISFILFSLSFASFAHGARAPWRRRGRKVKVKIKSIPTGASIYIEDKKWGVAGTTPSSWIRLPRNNSYKVILTHPDMEDFVTTIRLTRRYRNRFTFTMKKKIFPGYLKLSDDGTGNSTGASITIDGINKGTIPAKIKLMPGKYAVSIKKAGFKSFSKVITISEKSTESIMVALIKIAIPMGNIVVSSDVSNALVEIDKKAYGKVPALIKIKPGNHLVVVTHGEKKFQQIVVVTANKTSQVFAKLKVDAVKIKKGVVTIVCNITGADVLIDGISKGKTPVGRVDLLVGQHLIEIKKAGYISEKRTLTIKLNEQTLENFELKMIPKTTPMGKLKITTITGAKILLDGQVKGTSSLQMDHIKTGTYQLEVIKPGYKKVIKTITILQNKFTSMHIPLERVGTIKIISNVVGAEVIIDNNSIGKVPLLNYELPVGTYRLEIVKKGYRPYTKTIQIYGGKTEPVTYNINLLPIGLSPMDIARMKSSLSAFGAKTIPPKSFTASAGMDWPYYLDSKLMVGIYRKGDLGIDGGATFRTYFNMTEFLFNLRGQFFVGGPLTLGGFLDIGGGVGTESRANFTMNLGGMGTLSFREKVNLSIGVYLNITRDRFCLSSPADGAESEPSYCPAVGESGSQMSDWAGHSLRDPYWMQRLMFSATVEWSLSPKWSVYGKLKWAATSFNSEGNFRPAYMDYYNKIMPVNDTQFYGGAGFMWKF
jgi:hypothetical protein